MVLIAIGVLCAQSTPAVAHGTGSVGRPTNFRSVIDSITPNVAGVSIRMLDMGERIELKNSSDKEVFVLGYNSEPYLRVGKDGTFVNILSPAFFLNRESVPTDSTANGADPTKPPDWQRLSDSSTVTWHDHRAHWMSDQLPPQVRAEPDKPHEVIPRWTIEIMHDDQQIIVVGHLSWIPAQSPVGWYVLSCVLLFLIASIALLRQWRLLICATLLVLIVIDVLHSLGAIAEVGFNVDAVGFIIESTLASVIAWIAGGYAVFRILRGNLDGLWYGLFAAVLIAFFGGITDSAVFHHSQTPSALPPTLVRSVVAVSSGVGVGLVIALVSKIFFGNTANPIVRDPVLTQLDSK